MMTDSSKVNHPVKFAPALPGYWQILCLINLMITSLLGLTMRYKIIFPLPSVDLVNVLHAHVHFVFNGWVSLTLLSCIVAFVLPRQKAARRIYKILFWLLELSAVGVLVAFIVDGFNDFSISFLAIIFVTLCIFVVNIWRDLDKSITPIGVRLFLKGGIISLILSLPGVLNLVRLDVMGGGSPITIRASLYYFLHFQYNGWFTFCLFALLLSWLNVVNFKVPKRTIKLVFWLLALGLITGYSLSIIAFYPLILIRVSAFISVVAHFVAGFILFILVIKDHKPILADLPDRTITLWKIATAAFFLKIVMQGATLSPALAKFAFAFRPLIIGYLHLAFLCFITFFLIGYLLYYRRFRLSGSFVAKIGLWIFVLSVLISEVGLFAQSYFAYIRIYSRYFSVFMFWITVGIALGLVLFVIGQIHRKKLIPVTMH